MKKYFDKNLEENFIIACELSERNLSHEEIIAYLDSGNIAEKQIAALSLTHIESAKDAHLLLNNLTGCDGKIREAVALKINQLLHTNAELLEYFNCPEKFADATIDINGNICRLVIDSISILKKDKNFTKNYLAKLLELIYESYNELDKFVFRDKKYVINKQLFKLYWCLESLKLFVHDISKEELLQVLNRASKEKEYTIREKVAQIIVNLSDQDFIVLKQSLSNDENYYVRKALSLD